VKPIIVQNNTKHINDNIKNNTPIHKNNGGNGIIISKKNDTIIKLDEECDEINLSPNYNTNMRFKVFDCLFRK
jgi:hypothetical protein